MKAICSGVCPLCLVPRLACSLFGLVPAFCSSHLSLWAVSGPGTSGGAWSAVFNGRGPGLLLSSAAVPHPPATTAEVRPRPGAGRVPGHGAPPLKKHHPRGEPLGSCHPPSLLSEQPPPTCVSRQRRRWCRPPPLVQTQTHASSSGSQRAWAKALMHGELSPGMWRAHAGPQARERAAVVARRCRRAARPPEQGLCGIRQQHPRCVLGGACFALQECWSVR